MIPLFFKRLLLAAGTCALGTGALAAGEWPAASAITLVVGYGAGGGTDVCNRALALEAGKLLGQNVVVDNKPGAGSSLSVSYAVAQRPDGYHIASLSTSGLLNQVLTPGTKYDLTRDITPIAMVAQYQYGALVRADSPLRSMAQLIAAARASAKPLSYSTAGIGTPQHLTSERLAQQTGVQLTHVPYKSAPEAITAVLRGDVDFMAETATWVPHVRDGRLHLLAVYTDARMPEFDAPTLRELGYDLVTPSMLGIYGPAGMDAGVVAKFEAAFRQASQSATFQNCADQFGLKPDFKGAAEFSAHIRETLATWTPLLKKFAARE